MCPLSALRKCAAVKAPRGWGEPELQYQTDPDAIRAVLPDCHRPAEEPTVTVLFGYNDGLGFMAGSAYRLGTVQAAARFDGERDHVVGDYVLVIFEDEAVPIIGGREFLGVPKIERLWLGKSGQVYLGDPGEEDVAYTKRAIDALKTLPVRQATQTARLRGSALLRYDLSRRLR